MHSRKTVLIVDLMNAANMELIRLDFRSSTLSRHDKEFRRFCNYCTENGIQTYDAETGPQYFKFRFGLNIGDANIKLNRQQLEARNSIRFLDDIFQFGYALRYSHHDYTLLFIHFIWQLTVFQPEPGIRRIRDSRPLESTVNFFLRHREI